LLNISFAKKPDYAAIEKKNSVLIVDDENSNIIALTHILNPEYIVYAAKNGANAIQAAEKYLPDVILLDIIMPEMDGYAVLANLRVSKKTQNIPVIFITGLSDAAEEEKGLALGVADYIAKPFSSAIVKLRLRNQMMLIEQFRSNEYDIMKYKLSNDALNIALWDMDVVNEDQANPNNRFTWSNEFRRMLGFSNENDFPNLLHSWSDQLHPEDKERVLNDFAAHINDRTGKTRYDIEYRLMLKNGKYRHFQALGTTFRDNVGAPIRVAGALMDITEKKQMIEKIKEDAKNKAEIEMANRAKSAFLANMSHEIRTPMNAILGITEIMLQSKSLPAEIEEGLGKIYSSCDLLLCIINDILDFSKIEAGKMDIMPAQYSVASLINDSIHLNMMRINDKPIEFEIQVDENVPSKLIGDELRIKQILNNLLSNAFKYTDIGKVTLSVVSQPCEKGVMLVFGVRDTGNGMTQEQVAKLFEEYSRFNETDRTVEGTGLGLAITQRLAKLMGAEIHVESKLGKGSLFTIRLPQGMVDSEVLGKELTESLRQFHLRYMASEKKPKVIRDPMPYGSVLVVDDVETNLYVSEGLMKPYKLQVDTAMSGFEAIDKIKAGKVYDIVFMDHMMPKMDGIETTKQLRDLGYTAPIVALTANAVVGQADIFLQNGFDDFISKPIDVRHLNSILNKLVRDKQPKSSLLLESFIRDANKTVAVLEEVLQKNIESEELRKFTISVHGIKSSLGNIGEAKLSEAAYKLEQAGKEQNIDLITASVPKFLEELRALLKKLESKQETNCADEDIESLRKKLLIVQEMCEDYNRKGALDILEEIKKNCSKEMRAILNNITELVLHSEFEKAQSILKGLERYEGEVKTYLKILRSYAANTSSLLDSIENFNEAQLADYEIIVHGIKGASYDIFAEQIAASAKDLEKAAIIKDLGYINKHNPAFFEITRNFIYYIENMLSAIDAENPKPQKDKPDEKALSKLLAACKIYDIDEVDAAMAEIDRYQYVSDNGLANWLRENADIMNFTQIVEKLSDKTDN
ncbi:MAG: response regulator, partial [Fibromonadales bacterium]|nr:response regulator [Fibromonadales bacterium]